jgi:hypothetical protein
MIADAEQYYTSISGSVYTASNESWELVLEWLKECTSSHPECPALNQIEWIPTRLLDVGTSDKDSIKLVITAQDHQIKSYVTLSHCWGGKDMLKLTKETASSLMHGVPIHDLPLTFQHTIEVTRRLRKRYIWIDSLCIYQDNNDTSDWLREGLVMDKVYAHSFLNIAATGADDGSKGLFVTRDPDYELRPTSTTWWPPSQLDVAAEDATEYVLNDVFLFDRELMSAPLNRRAWVLQERLLAPRVLHFGAGQIFWECKRGTLCERFPKAIPSFMRNFAHVAFKSLTRANGKPIAWNTTSADQKSRRTNAQAYSLWNQYVTAYSASLLTYQSDKMIALLE